MPEWDVRVYQFKESNKSNFKDCLSLSSDSRSKGIVSLKMIASCCHLSVTIARLVITNKACFRHNEAFLAANLTKLFKVFQSHCYLQFLSPKGFRLDKYLVIMKQVAASSLVVTNIFPILWLKFRFTFTLKSLKHVLPSKPRFYLELPWRTIRIGNCPSRSSA